MNKKRDIELRKNVFYISCWSIFSQICIKICLKDVFKKILWYFNTQEYYVTPADTY